MLNGIDQPSRLFQFLTYVLLGVLGSFIAAPNQISVGGVYSSYRDIVVIVQDQELVVQPFHGQIRHYRHCARIKPAMSRSW